MRDDEEIALAKRLPAGARKALLAMTEEFQLPGRDTFNANAAFNLKWQARTYGGLVEEKIIKRRAAYRPTPLGWRIRDRLTASAMSAGTDETRSGSGLQPASAVGEAETPK